MALDVPSLTPLTKPVTPAFQYERQINIFVMLNYDLRNVISMIYSRKYDVMQRRGARADKGRVGQR